MVNPFDGIKANKVVQGVVLAPDVVTTFNSKNTYNIIAIPSGSDSSDP